MSVLFADDFSGYGTGNSQSPPFMLDGIYAAIDQAYCSIDPDPSATGNVFQSFINGVNSTRLRRVFPGPRDTVGVALRCWMDILPPNNTSNFSYSFQRDTGAFLASISIDTIGRITFRLGNANGNSAVIAQTGGPVVTARAWNHIEWKAPCSSTSGTHIIKVNGATVLTVPAINIGLQASQFCIDAPNASGSGYTFYTKDLVVWDSLGSRNNDFFGPVQVLGRLLNGDVSKGGWLPNSGTTLYQMIDNLPPQDSTQFITAAYPPPAACTFTVTHLPSDITSVRALITQVRARNIDGGDGSMQTSLISNGVAVAGTARPITSAFTFREDIFETDPNTGAAWTPPSSDAVVVKLDRTV